MRRDELGELVAFLAVCEERSFTRAAARLGTSQSALSHTVKRLEERLDLRLLTRTTRSVAPTDAGEQLAATLRPALDEIEARLEGLTALRARPAGTIRISSNRSAARDILYPKLARLMADHPDIKVEISVEQSFVDIVEERFDAGVRLGESVERDMIAVRIGPDKRMLVAGAPAYFARHGRPRDAARADRACLHQPAPADARRPLRLGVRAGRAAAQRPRRGAVHLQRRRPYRRRGHRRPRPLLPARRASRAAGRGRPARGGARGLEPAVPRLPPLLPEPAAVLPRLRAPRGGAALARLRRGPRRAIGALRRSPAFAGSVPAAVGLRPCALLPGGARVPRGPSPAPLDPPGTAR